VGGPARCEEAAKRRTALTWPVGPTLRKVWYEKHGRYRARGFVAV
jgi:hypothetical protein